MKILVCVKQVPIPEVPIRIDTENCWIHEGEEAEYCMNRYDEHAIEEALLIKELFSGVTVDAISVGPERVASTLRKALALGVQNGIHILFEDRGYPSSHEIASLIADYARGKAYDLILAGVMAEDDMQSIVGPMVASMLTLPCATAVVKETVDMEKKRIAVTCEVEGGVQEAAVLEMPCLLTIQSGINVPRYPALSNMLRSKSQKLERIKTNKQCNCEPKVIPIFHNYFEKKEEGLILEGNPTEKADKLLDFLHEKSLI